MTGDAISAEPVGDCATFLTERRGVGFIARCMCGWENSAAGYDYSEALTICGTHASRHMDADDVRAVLNGGQNASGVSEK